MRCMACWMPDKKADRWSYNGVSPYVVIVVGMKVRVGEIERVDVSIRKIFRLQESNRTPIHSDAEFAYQIGKFRQHRFPGLGYFYA